MSGRWLAFAGAVLVVALSALVAGRVDRSATPEARTHAIASELRCPVCLNLSVADSPSRLAGAMRAEILDQLRAGRTEEQVRAYFVARYGDWILLEPEGRGLELVPVLFPAAAVLVGIGVWALAVRRRARSDPAPVATEQERGRIRHELAAMEDPR
jgi:cytochrome c-type biogenesis protein CcmH